MITPSETTVSDLMISLKDIAEQIDSILLVGEKVDYINEGGDIYNRLRSLVTPQYFTDEEHDWLCALGTSWNEEVRAYDATMGKHNATKTPQSNQDILDALQDSIDEMMDRFDGEDGAW